VEALFSFGKVFGKMGCKMGPETLNLAGPTVSLIATALGVIAGGTITWLASRHYYLKAGSDLRREAAELRHLTVLILRGLEESKMVEFTKDAAGKPIGLRIELSGHA